MCRQERLWISVDPFHSTHFTLGIFFFLGFLDFVGFLAGFRFLTSFFGLGWTRLMTHGPMSQALIRIYSFAINPGPDSRPPVSQSHSLEGAGKPLRSGEH